MNASEADYECRKGSDIAQRMMQGRFGENPPYIIKSRLMPLGQSSILCSSHIHLIIGFIHMDSQVQKSPVAVVLEDGTHNNIGIQDLETEDANKENTLPQEDLDSKRQCIGEDRRITFLRRWRTPVFHSLLRRY